MKLLAINTALDKVELNLWELSTPTTLTGAKKLLAKNSWVKDRNESDKLLPAISAILASEQVEINDVKNFLVVNGPGSFVSIRLGVLLANTFAQNIEGANLYSLSTFTYFSFCGADLVIFDAGGQDVYVCDPARGVASIIKWDEISLENLANFDVGSGSDGTIRTAGIPKIIIHSKREKQIKELLESLIGEFEQRNYLPLDSVMEAILEQGKLEEFKIDAEDFPLNVNYVKEPAIQKEG